VIKGEAIGHEEKIFSVFEQYTEWINSGTQPKGKSNPSVELGKKLAITTDQFNLIINFKIMEDESDSEIVLDISSVILKKYKVDSWSFDKGYWHKINKELLQTEVSQVVMPKKGKCNKFELEEEKTNRFKLLRNKHSAVESNINELENRGLGRCPDRGFEHFKSYVCLGICAYNLHKIETKIRHDEMVKVKKIPMRVAA